MTMEEAKNPYADWSDNRLIAEASVTGLAQGAMVAEMMRQLKGTTVAQSRVAENLGNKLWWLNLWLLLFTIAIAAMTGVLVWLALRTGSLK